MRFFNLALLSAVALLRSCSGEGSVEPVTQSTGMRFRDAIGVNVHLQYAATRYHDADAVARALDYLGITHVRDGGFRRGDEAFANYVQLAHRGVGFDLFLNADLPGQIQRVDRFAHAAPGALDALEGPNEVNNDPISFAGRTGAAGAQAYQAALYERAKADPLLSGLPILNYTNWPPTGGWADAVNVHTYAKPGVGTRAQIARDIALAAAAFPSGLPRYITETGAPTSLTHRQAPWLSPDEQANQTLISLFEAFRAGVRRTYVYELFDEAGDTNTNPEAHYGIFEQDGAPKRVAQELRTLLWQVGSRTSGVPGLTAPAITVEGARSLILSTAPGTSLLLIWPAKTHLQATSVLIRMSQAVFVRELELQSGQFEPGSVRAAWHSDLSAEPRAYVLGALTPVRQR